MILFHNGPIHTMDPACPSPEVVLVGEDGRVRAVGSLAEIDDPNAMHFDLRGRTLIPGFNDAHVHVVWLGFLLTQLVDARIHVAPDIPTIVDKFAARAQTQKPDTWVVGVGYNEALLPEGRHLTRHDLDRASTQHPMTLTRTCGHISVVNSRALQLAGITAQTPDPPGGVIVRDDRGEPTGILP